jgi:hypothetical protein
MEYFGFQKYDVRGDLECWKIHGWQVGNALKTLKIKWGVPWIFHQDKVKVTINCDHNTQQARKQL